VECVLDRLLSFATKVLKVLPSF